MEDESKSVTAPVAAPAAPAPPVAPAAPVAPVPLERAALERALARAAELQAQEADPGELTLTEAQILDVGNEVGIPAKHLRQALAEERSRVAVPVERGRIAALFGAATVSASRTVRGTPAALFDRLDEAMQREESLRVKRRFPDRIAWEPRGGMATEFRRILNVGGHGYRLARAEEVSATVIAVDAERSIVRLDASLANVRSQRLAGGASLLASGGVATGILVALGVMAAVAALPVAAGVVAGYFVARSHGPQVAGAQLALEQMLDRLERGELLRPSLLSAITASAGLRWP
ncbi:MAG TPA: hypothetical protein VK617_02905 [Gemmatimonadaceae bacterium]|nr:hypothetical protein [Gemmatimonadaceae bacterium]